MIDKLTIENFQSHRRTELGLAPGVTVLVGESDVGKSAVVRALRWLFLNEPRGAGFVRHGAAACRVIAQYGDGTVIERTRNRERNFYAVEKPGGEREVYEGFGADVPEEISSVTGVRKVAVGDLSFTPNIAGQLEPPFLLAEPGSAAASLLGALSRADVFDAALKDALADITRLRRESRALESEIASLNEELEKYADLPRWREALEAANTLLEEAKAAFEKKEALRALFSEHLEAKAAFASAGRLVEAGAVLDGAARLAAEGERGAGRKAALETCRRELASLKGEVSRSLSVLRSTEGAGEAGVGLATAGLALERAFFLGAAGAERRRLKENVVLFEKTLAAAGGADAAEEILGGAGSLREKCSRLRASCEELRLTGKRLAEAERIEEVTAGTAQAETFVTELHFLAERLKSVAALQEQRREAAEAVGAAGRIAEAGEAVGEAESLSISLLLLVGERTALVRLSGERREAGNELAQLAELEAEVSAALEREAEEFGNLLKKLGRCPVCFNKIEEGDVHEIVKQLAG